MVIVVALIAIVTAASFVVVAAAVLSSRISRVAGPSSDEGVLDSPLQAS